MDLLFYLSFATLMAHELDAMTQAEWRLLFILRSLPESAAAKVFIVIHIPLIAGLLWLTNHSDVRICQGSRLATALFLMVHAGLHKRLEHLLAYTFDSSLSLGLIYGGALLGLLYLIAVIVNRQRNKTTLA